MTQKSYEKYSLSIKEYFLYGLLFWLILFCTSYLFYDHFIPAILFSPCIVLYFRYIRSYLCICRKKQLLLQFRDMILSISVSLGSGYSLENSIRECDREMRLLYGEGADICIETALMTKKLTLNIPIETIFYDFAVRSQCPDILMFSQILNIAKRTGGDLISIIKTSSETIGEKIDIQREIQTSISSKRFEQNIMSVMPLAIMAYIRFTSHDFFDTVYHNPTGICIMTVSLLIYILAVLLGIRLSSVKI